MGRSRGRGKIWVVLGEVRTKYVQVRVILVQEGVPLRGNIFF